MCSSDLLSIDVVQAALDNSSIPTGCSILAIPISISISITVLTLVLCRLLRIGAFFGVVASVPAFKADNIGLGVEVVDSSWTVVVIGTVVVVWAVWIGVAWGLWWSISRLGCWWKSAGLLVT